MTDELPEEVAGPETRELGVAADDPGGARDDDVEPVADLALEDDRLARR